MFTKIQKWMKGKKTYILAGLAFCVVFVGFLAGDLSFMEFMQTDEFKWLWAIITAATLRAGISKHINVVVTL